jgi:hypothetical protein
MTIQGIRPEAEQRLRELAEARQPADSPPIDMVIAAFMAGAADSDTKELVRQVMANHQEFFDMIGDR